MRLVFVQAAWRRYEVTRLALAQRAHLCGVLAERGIHATAVVVADDENLDIASEFGFETVEQTNAQLGRKFNDGYEFACRQMDADYVVHIGSDDWVHPDVFDRLPLAHPEPPQVTPENPVVTWSDAPEVVAGTEIALVDLVCGTLRHCRYERRQGVIPWVLPRAALEPSGFRPVRDDQRIGIDFALVAGLGIRPQWVFHDPHPLARVDFKSDLNLNLYEAVAGVLGVGEDVSDPWPLLADIYPSELVGLARETHEGLAPRNLAVASAS